ncbi:MAG: hypothetical protein IJ677_02800 [Alphaproteobacteria bacterium]|nr:hypothetical protein [Alphaproteobacteria bacterium]
MDEDYIKTLTTEEKIIFLKVFCAMVRADGVIDAEEISFLKKISLRYGVDNATIIDIIKNAATIDYVTETRKITNRKHSLQLIKELCVLANIDESLHDSELDIIIDTANAMGVESDKVVLINRWVLDSLILARTGDIILEQNNE